MFKIKTSFEYEQAIENLIKAYQQDIEEDLVYANKQLKQSLSHFDADIRIYRYNTSTMKSILLTIRPESDLLKPQYSGRLEHNKDLIRENIVEGIKLYTLPIIQRIDLSLNNDTEQKSYYILYEQMSQMQKQTYEKHGNHLTEGQFKKKWYKNTEYKEIEQDKWVSIYTDDDGVNYVIDANGQEYNLDQIYPDTIDPENTG
jgi:hypothetical protein